LKKSIESRLHPKVRFYRFQLKRGLSIGEHMNIHESSCRPSYMDVEIEEEDKAVILRNSLPNEEYETFILTLINGK